MSTPPIPTPNPSPAPAAGPIAEERPDGRTEGIAPPKGEMLEHGTQATAQTSAPPPAPAPSPTIREGVEYRTPDGEDRLVWVVRNGRVEYFARRDRGRWTPTLLERGAPAVEDFARQVGMADG